jgi:transposase-like protein
MTNISTKLESQPAAETAVHLFDNWFDAIEAGLRDRVREFINAMIEGELDTALSRPRYVRDAKPSSGKVEGAVRATGHRHGHRSRSLLGSFGQVEIEVPRARLNTPDGKTTEWKSTALRAYQRRTLIADALIAGAYLAGTNTRRVRRALAALFGGAVGKDTVSRVWRKVKTDWDAWNARSLAEEPIVRLILDGTVVRVRLDRKATSISLLVVLGVREDGQKVLLAIKSMGGESTEAWRTVLDDLIKRGLRRPEFLIVDGAAGLDKAIAAVWDGVPVQRCTVHKHRNLLAQATRGAGRLPTVTTRINSVQSTLALECSCSRLSKRSCEKGGGCLTENESISMAYEFRTKSAQSGGLETNGRRDTFLGLGRNVSQASGECWARTGWRGSASPCRRNARVPFIGSRPNSREFKSFIRLLRYRRRPSLPVESRNSAWTNELVDCYRADDDSMCERL